MQLSGLGQVRQSHSIMLNGRMKRIGRPGLGQASSCNPGAMDASTCSSGGGVPYYDDQSGNYSTCICPAPSSSSPPPGTVLNPPGTGLTTAQQQAICESSNMATWNAATGQCVSTPAPPAPDTTTGSLANNCANNPNPGTFSDVNCPWWCVPFLASSSGACYPCYTACPAGTNYDTTNGICSPNPVTTNCKQGAAGNQPFSVPGYVWLGLGIVAALMVMDKVAKL